MPVTPVAELVVDLQQDVNNWNGNSSIGNLCIAWWKEPNGRQPGIKNVHCYFLNQRIFLKPAMLFFSFWKAGAIHRFIICPERMNSINRQVLVIFPIKYFLQRMAFFPAICLQVQLQSSLFQLFNDVDILLLQLRNIMFLAIAMFKFEGPVLLPVFWTASSGNRRRAQHVAGNPGNPWVSSFPVCLPAEQEPLI